MTWARFDDAMGDHRKVKRALRAGGPATFALHALAILHCSRYLTDGFVEAEFVDEFGVLAGVKSRDITAATDALVAHGLWDVEDGGWRVHDYLDWNPSREQVLEQRRREAERKAAGRRKQSGGTPGAVRAESARTVAGVRAESDGPVPSRPVPSQITPPNPPQAGGGKSNGRRGRQPLVAVASRSGEQQARTWCEANVPDLDAGLAAAAVLTLGGSGMPVTPGAVRERVLARYGDEGRAA